MYANINNEGSVILTNGRVRRVRQRNSTRTYEIPIQGGGEVPIFFKTSVKGVVSEVIRMKTVATPAGADRDRSEFTVSNSIESDKIYYVGYKFYLPYDSINQKPNNWFIITQFRQEGSTFESPSLSIGIRGNEFRIVGRNNNDPYEILMTRDITNLYNKWIEIRLRVRLGDNGDVTLWFNGGAPETVRHDFDWNCGGCTNFYKLKFGIYRGITNFPYFVNFDDFKVANYYAF